MTDALSVTQPLSIEMTSDSTSTPTFDDVYGAYLPYVWTLLRRFGVSDVHREDLVHDVFVVVHARLASFDVARPMKPWLFGICFNVASDHTRRASVRSEVANEAVLATARAHGPSVEDELIRKERARRVEQAIAAIELERRAVFLLHEIDETPIPAVAEALGIPLNTAYSRLRLAREEFKAAYVRFTKREEGSR